MMQQEYSKPVSMLDLVDESGQPFCAEIQSIFLPLQGRFRRAFPAIRDEAVIRNLFDAAGQGFARAEQKGENIDKPEGYAWAILSNLAKSELRRSDVKVWNAVISGDAAEKAFASRQSALGTPEQIFARVYAREVYDLLTKRERICATLKIVGYSNRKVGRLLAIAPGSVDKMMQRVRDRVREGFAEKRRIRISD